MRNTVVMSFLWALLLNTSSAYAQEQGQIGLTMGYPMSVGVVWHPTDRIAIRPDMTFVSTWSESTSSLTLGFGGFASSSTTDTDTTNIGVDLSVLLYLKRWDNVRTYITPGFGYHWSMNTFTTTTQGPGFGTGIETLELTTRGHEIAGAFGVQYAPHRKFSIFGEAGVNYSSTKQGSVRSNNSSFGRPAHRSLGNTATVGVIFYFK